MKKKYIVQTVLLLGALALMIPPWGAVLNFGTPEGEPLRQTFSYFSLTPFGYANFGPFLSAVLLCVLLPLTVAQLFIRRKALGRAVQVVNGVDLLCSLLPLFYGVSYMSIPGWLISLCLAIVFVLSFGKKQPAASPVS